MTEFDENGNYVTTPKPFTMNFSHLESFVNFPPYACTSKWSNMVKSTFIISANATITSRCEELAEGVARPMSPIEYGDGYHYGISDTGIYNSCLIEVVIRGEKEGVICNAYFLPNRTLDCVGNGSPAMAVIDAARTDGPDASNALLDSYYKEIKPKEFPTRFRLALCRYFSVAQTDKALQRKYRDYVRRTREKGRAMLEDLGGDVYLSLMDALGF